MATRAHLPSALNLPGERDEAILDVVRVGATIAGEADHDHVGVSRIRERMFFAKDVRQVFPVRGFIAYGKRRIVLAGEGIGWANGGQARYEGENRQGEVSHRAGSVFRAGRIGGLFLAIVRLRNRLRNRYSVGINLPRQSRESI